MTSEFRIIYTRPEDNSVSIVVPAEGVTIEAAAIAVPQNLPYEVVDKSVIPTDREFRNAWQQEGNLVTYNIPKCKEIAHEKRRISRSKEFAPLDIEATIPSMAANAETSRQAIRNKYAIIQNQIDSANTLEDIKSALLTM